MMEEIYISIDIEADGRVPGLSSMLSLGAAAFTIDKTMHGTFSCNFDLLEGAKPEPKTEEFWKKNKKAYDETRLNTVSPRIGTVMFVAWLKEVSGNRRAIMVGYPAPFDYKWIDYYCVRFCDLNPFGHSLCFDIKSYAWAVLGGTFSHASKRNYRPRWFDSEPHTHVALQDAIGQGKLAINMIRDQQGLPPD